MFGAGLRSPSAKFLFLKSSIFLTLYHSEGAITVLCDRGRTFQSLLTTALKVDEEEAARESRSLNQDGGCGAKPARPARKS